MFFAAIWWRFPMIGSFLGPGGSRNLLFGLFKNLHAQNIDIKTEMAGSNQKMITSMFDFSVHMVST